MIKQLELKNTSYFARSKQQNFHEVEITSGYIVRLEKQTQENIRLAKQTTNNERENETRQRHSKE